MQHDDLRELVLNTIEQCLEAQLRAVRRLRPSQASETSLRRAAAPSHLDMAHQVLNQGGSPMHISDILRQIHAAFGINIDRESLVSSLTKRIARGDRFVRTGKNTFALHAEPR